MFSQLADKLQDVFKDLRGHGKITEVNAAINDSADIVNKDPYGAGWLLKIQMSDPGEVKSHTMPVSEYKALIGQ